MKEAKLVTTALGGHFKLIKKSCPSTRGKEKRKGVLFHIRQQLEASRMLWFEHIKT